MAVTFKGRPLIARLLDSAPQAGSGLNEWLAKGARMTSDLAPNESVDLLAEVVAARGGNRDERAILRAINKIRGTDYNGPSKPKWPEPDLGLIEELTLLRAWDVPGALATLESRSPDTLKRRTAGEIVSKLFEPDSYIATGFLPSCTAVSKLSNIRENLHKMAFLVPNPMRDKYGLTQEGRESGRCLNNVLHRRFVVVEFDFSPTDKQGNGTIWVPLIDLWKAHGMSTLDAQAALILRLMEIGPLVMVTFSGSKSLHSWFYCEGEPEHVGLPLHQFMSDVAMLGADTQLFTASQFARMPMGRRATGDQQTVHYLNFNAIQRR
jgi:hypothetical protein